MRCRRFLAAAVQVAALKPGERLIPAPPTDGLVLKVHARFLSRGGRGKVRSRGDSPTERIPPGVNPAYISPGSGYFADTK